MTDSNPPTTLVQMLSDKARQHPDRIAFTFLEGLRRPGPTLTFAQLDRRARAIAAMLQREGLAKERVLLVYPSGLDFVAAFFGCAYADAIAVPAYPPDPRRLKRTLPRLVSIIENCGASALLTTQMLKNLGLSMISMAPSLGELRWLASDAVPDSQADDWRAPNQTTDDIAFLQYTSGSTATPRGVMVTHANIIANEAQMQQVGDHTESSTTVSWLPLYHDLGLLGGVVHPIFLGAHGVLLSPMTFLEKPLSWLAAISDYRATASAAPNFAFDLAARRISEPERQSLDLSSWRMALMGGEPIRAATLGRFAQAFANCGFRPETYFPGYGLAEATLAVSSGRLGIAPNVLQVDSEALGRGQIVLDDSSDESTRSFVSCGPPLPGQDIRIVALETFEQCPPDRVGEIWVRGPSVARGYWGDSAQTESIFGARLAGDDGPPFLRTGDLGFIRDGEVYICGRQKDLIIINGANLYPEDIEETVQAAHQDISPGAIAAFSIYEDGEERLVVVFELSRRAVLGPDPTDINGPAAMIAGQVRLAVTAHHQVRASHILLLTSGSLPKTSSGKIQRHSCRNAFLAGELEVVARF